MSRQPDMESKVKRAREGDRAALEALVADVQDRIYGLSLRMLYHRQNAEDATQEILIKIITGLAGFRRESAFATWALKIAANHLRSKRRRRQLRHFTFEGCEGMILGEAPDPGTFRHFEAEQGLLVEEMRILCMQGLLQCLDPDHRLAYILGAIMDLSGPEAATILAIRPATFRKRLSRARESVRGFLLRHCDLFDTANACHCPAQAMAAAARGQIGAAPAPAARHPAGLEEWADIKAHLARLDSMAREVALMRINQDYRAPERFIQGIQSLLSTGGPLLGQAPARIAP